jgi:5-methylcytosine-specific restriction protein B
MGITKDIILEIVNLCQIMSDGRNDGSITTKTYSEKFKPFLEKFHDNYKESPNLYLQNELKIFNASQLKGLSPNIYFKNFGYWGRTIYNYTWACIYYEFEKVEMQASYSPQLYILINKEGIKFGFCYGHQVNDDNEMVVSALSKNKFSFLKKCLESDKDLCFFNAAKEEVTARPEKLFGKNERININSDKDIINNWSSNSLLIKEYYKDNIPENVDEIIQNTLLNLKDFFLSLLPITRLENDNVKPNNVNQIPFDINSIKSNIKSSGLQTNDKLISRFVSSLLTKPFVILTGLSGSGKTKLAQAFATWICENENQYCIVPVGADWTNREPMLGFPNALKVGDYVKPDNKVLDLIIEASKEENNIKPFFLILDEMNLSHVERYFADFLSVMETKEKISLHAGVENWNNVPSKINIPENLFIIGTVNIDETTYMFSPKVLDRANVIEFRVTPQEMKSYLSGTTKLDLESLKSGGANMAGAFMEIAKDKSLQTNNVADLQSALMIFFSELKKTGAEFGYRSASEIFRFAAVVNTIEPNWTMTDIIDAAIMQKLLPKVHGSRRKLEPVLKTLGTLCLQNSQNIDEFISSKAEINFDDTIKIKYPISLEKILRMYHGLIDNGFTSYAEA